MKAVLVCLLIALVAPSVMSRSPKVMNNLQKLGLISDAELQATWYELIDAFFDGAQVENLVQNSTKCVKELEKGNDDMYKVFYNVYWYGFTWQYYLDFNGALGDLTPIIRTCYDVIDNSTIGLIKHFSRFVDIVDFAVQAKDNCVRNLFTWYDVYSRITDAMNRGLPKDVSYQVGRSVRLFLDFVPKQTASNVNLEVSLPDFRPFEDFIVGFLNGTRVISSPSIKKCINETEFIVASFEDGNRCFQNGTVNSFRCAVFEVADVAEHLKPFNAECSQAGLDVYNTILKYIQTFKTPSDFFLNAMRHLYEIWTDTVAIYQYILNANWKGAGYNIGEIVFFVFIDQPK
jgi:hypothetical protein